MNVPNDRSLTRSEHRRHDRLLVTRFAMDDAYPTERDEALTLVETCSECAALAADVRLIANAMPRLPLAPRTRDFTISAEQAERLRGSGFARWLRTLAMPGWGALRPVAGVALSIGLVMAVVGTTVPSLSPPAQTNRDLATQAGAPEVAPLPAPTIAAAQGGQDLPPAVESDRGQAFAEASQDPVTDALNKPYVEPSPNADDGDAQRTDLARTLPVDPTRDLLVYAGLIIAMLSLGLLALAWIARRYFADPLLR